MRKINISQILSMLFNNKRFLIAFSVIFAIIFWLVIDIAENPSREITLSGIPITIAEQTDDNGNVLSPIGEYIDSVSVTVNGPGYIVTTISKDEVSVSVSSYAEVTKPGTYVLTLTATTTKNGCDVSKISPSFIKVVYDYDTSSKIPVEVDTSEYNQFVAADCEINKSNLKNNADNAEITELEVSGPSEIIGSISKVVVKPVIKKEEVTGITQNFRSVLTFYDAVGKPVDATELVYNKDTYVRIVVYKTADVSLVPTFSNMPEYYAQTQNKLPSYTLTVYNEVNKKQEKVTMVKVKGPVDTVDGLVTSGLTLSPIDFAQVKPQNTSFNVSFVLSEGVEVVDGTEEVTISLNLGSLTTKTITIDPDSIKFEKLLTGFNASTTYKKNVKVVLCGKSAVLRKINAGNLKLYVDCSLIISASTETKVLKVGVPKEYEAWVNTIDPVEISITVE